MIFPLTAPPNRALRSLLCVSVVLMMAAGCAEQTIRRQSQEAMVSGDYETAVSTLQSGLKQYPDSALLRGGLLQARAEASSRMVTAAATLRAQGRLDEAGQELNRAKAMDPLDIRLDALLAELVTQRRQQSALVEADKRLASRQPDAALRIIEQALKDNPRYPGLLALQRRIELDLRQSQSAATQRALAETRPISLDFRDANLRTVLDVVSRNSGINFILDRDIRPDTRVTVFLRQARVEDALDLIIGTNQLAKKLVDSQTIVVYPNTPEKQREYQEQIVRVFYLASAEAKGAAAFLRAMLKIREPFVDDRSNMLALRESQENIQLAERLISLYDAGDPEVLLEVEVIEVGATRLTELGVKFPDSLSLTPLAPAAGWTLGNIGSLDRNRVGLGFSGLLVNFKRAVGDFNTLANPRIRARNKEKAKILIGDRVPVITTTTGTGGFVSDSVSYVDVGLKLDVEPTVYADDEVAIKIALEVSSLGTSVKTNSGTLAYQIGTRNAATVLRLHDGETQLLAGLISKDERTSSSRVPGVGDLPVLGRLFSSQQDSGQRTELVLAITPRILRNIRRLDASESELWVGTDALPRLRLPVLASGLAEQLAAPGGAAALPAPAATSLGGPLVAPPALALGGPLAGPPTPLADPGGTVLLQWAAPASVPMGQAFEARVQLSAAMLLRGMPLEFSYDQRRLLLLDAIEGDFFKRDNAPTSFTHSVDAAGGRARVGVLRNQAHGIAGQGAVVILRFKALAQGDAAIRLEGAQPVHLGGTAPQVLPVPAWMVRVH